MLTLEDYEKQERANAKTYLESFVAQARADGAAASDAIERNYAEAVNHATTSYETAKKDTAASYRSLYDANAVSEHVRRRQLSERMANMGLSNSGTMIGLQGSVHRTREYNDRRVSEHKQQSIRTLDDQYDVAMREYDAWRDSEKKRVSQAVDQSIAEAAQFYNEQADAQARKRYDEEQARVEQDRQHKEPEVNTSSLKHRTERTGELRGTFTDKNGTHTGYEAGEIKTQQWAQRLWDSGAFGKRGTYEAQTGVAQYLFAQYTANNLENSETVNKIYKAVTGDDNSTVLADGFLSLLPERKEYETAHGNGSFDSFVQEKLIKAIATGAIGTYEELNKIISQCGIKELSVKESDLDIPSDLFREVYGIVKDGVDSYNESIRRLQTQYPTKHDEEVTLSPSQQEFYRLRAGDGRYTVDISDKKLNDKVNIERGTFYGPREIEIQFDFGDEKSDNLNGELKASSAQLPERPFESASHEIELTELYKDARDGEGKLFLHIDGGIDFTKVPDYQSFYSQYMQLQTQDNKSLSENQKKIYTAAFLVAMYDGLNDQHKRDGAYDPYLYLAYEDFYHRLANGEIEGIDFDTIAFALGELNNHKNGKKIAKDITKSSLAAKLLFGFGFKAGEAIESIANLSTTISGKVTPISTFGTAYDTVGETLDGGIKTAYTVSGTLGYMTPYMLTGAAGSPVAGGMVMFAQGLSSSMNSALREGQSYMDSLGYGIASATMELALNKLLGATGGALGKSVLGKSTSSFLQKGLAKISASPLVKKLLEFGGERLVAGAGEYTEESLQVYTDALMRNFFFDEHHQLHARNEEATYNGWIGFIVGVLLGDGKSNTTASTQLLDGTAKENLNVVKNLYDATQIFSLNEAQRGLVNAMLTNAERLSDGKGGNPKLLQTQVQNVLNLWTETAQSPPTAVGADPVSARDISAQSTEDTSPASTHTPAVNFTAPTVEELTAAFIEGAKRAGYVPPKSSPPTTTPATNKTDTSSTATKTVTTESTVKIENASIISNEPTVEELTEAFNAGARRAGYIQPKDSVAAKSTLSGLVGTFASEGGRDVSEVSHSDSKESDNYLRNNLPRAYVDTRSVGAPITKEQLAEILDFAKAHNVQIGRVDKPTGGFDTYCGDVDVLKNIVLEVEKQQTSELYKQSGAPKPILIYDNVLGYYGDNSKVDVYAFAVTNGKTITLNKFMFDDSEYMNKEYNASAATGHLVKGTDYHSVIAHEMGHIIDKSNPRLKRRILYLLQREADVQGTAFDLFIENNISLYASTLNNDGLYSEVVAEINSLLRHDKNHAIIQLLRKEGVF